MKEDILGYCWKCEDHPDYSNVTAKDEHETRPVLCEVFRIGADGTGFCGDSDYPCRAMLCKIVALRPVKNKPVIEKCSVCNGHGTVYTAEGDERICPDCNGAGKVCLNPEAQTSQGTSDGGADAP